MHVPEEIIHAAGLLPVVLWEGDEPVTEGYTYIQPFFCGFIRGVIDLAVKGKLDFLDGIVGCDECVSTEAIDFLLRRRRLFDYWEFLFLPADQKGDTNKAYVMQEFERLRASLGQYTGKELDDDSLKHSISLYNRNRFLLRKLYELRREKPTVLKAREMYAVVMSSMLMPKEEHNELLESLISELASKESSEQKVRLFLSGTLCSAPKSEFLDLIEETGGAIVDDDLYVGARYFDGDVPINA
jgi:benzoyl-CoA reductase subunit C